MKFKFKPAPHGYSDLLATRSEAVKLREYMKLRGFAAVVERSGEGCRVRLNSPHGVAYIADTDDVTAPDFAPHWV